ncbi:hypothetical protein CHCC14820_1543 [Bacillus paralicheniformis]|nr:hypothetical protein B4123_4185 [Bacillus paralicheniformis]TWJ60496.1 hypothetical protein CHCC5023_4485 [Bacillus paralicheniformis]TWJ61825.1 hypothetical protein CHCC5022_2297 [Bacillus paralicheniformis]TWJ70067.1 hypothetical protein CHCC4186_1542 [Bacillus paralicheniformis]TWM30091.1 hypothetical protein CHCC14820_1543 [Bacillus paralicheniformis]
MLPVQNIEQLRIFDMLSEHHILLKNADHTGQHFMHVKHFVAPVIHMLHSFIALIDLHLRLVLLFHSNVSSLNVIQLLYFVFAVMFIQKRNNR